jgi:signal transduction histidine kinase
MQMAKKHHSKRRMYLQKSGEFIESVIVEIRKISKKLVIPGTHIIGLFDNIKNLVHDMIAIHPIKIGFHAENITEEDLDEKLQLNVYRIIQEQVNNVIKHAGGTLLTIHLSRKENEIILLISDNGKGCDTGKEKNGVGIINIRSRAELYYGSVAIESSPGEGFKLKVVLSLKAPGMTADV